MKCYMVKDLLPNHIDGLNSEETSAEVSKHLDECIDCRTVYEQMTAIITPKQQTSSKEINFVKKLRGRMFRRNVVVAVSTCIILLAGLVIFARNYQIPIPFDPNRMSVDLIQVAVVYNDDGSASWWAPHLFYPQTEMSGVHYDIDPEIPVMYEYMRYALHITWHSFSRISTNGIGRDIIRDGQHVRVVFYRHTKTPWISLFFDYDLTGWQEHGRTTGTFVYGNRFQTVNQEPQMIEIYYLPVRNLIGLNNLSDEDFDAKRHNAFLIWSGMN